MSKTHNKKRNVGIIYDQMITKLCESYVEDDKDSINKIVKIIKENFKKGSQLQKELQFFNSFLKTKNISDSLSTAIVSEAKSACRHHFDQEDLDLEKSKLIKELNYSFGKGKIFETKVNNYTMYATIQTLLNEWREKDNPDFSSITEYEIKLNKWLTRKEENIIEESDYKDIDKITFKIMSNKFNEKYQSNLSDEQSLLINEYITSKENNNSIITEKFVDLKKQTLELLENFKNNSDNQYVLNKWNVVHENVDSLDDNDLSEENLKRFLVVSKLKDELLGE